MAKRSSEGKCGMPWPVCPDCAGAGLVSSEGESWCRRCSRRWPTSEVQPCPWPASEVLSDGKSASRVCASHAAHASAARLRPDRVRGLRVYPGGASKAQRRKDGSPGDYDPSKPSTEDYLDCTGRLRQFRLQEIAGGLFLEAVELRRGEATGQRFVLEEPREGATPWGELRTLIRARLAQRDVVQTPEGYALLTQRLRGQLRESQDDPGGEPPNVLVDDLELTWDQVGKLLQSFIGFGLRIEVVDPGAE